MVDDRNTIYAVDSMYSSAFKSSRLLLKNKELLPYDPYTISQLRVIKNGETTCELTFDADAQTWSLPQEYSQIVFDQTAVTPIINNITSIEAEELLARCIMHETDHLDGQLYVDIMSRELFDEDDPQDEETEDSKA